MDAQVAWGIPRSPNLSTSVWASRERLGFFQVPLASGNEGQARQHADPQYGMIIIGESKPLF